MSEVDKFLDGYGKTEPTKPAKTAPSEVDALMQSAPAQDKGMGGFLRDAGLSLAKGAVAVPEAAVGLADIVTGGRAGKFLENADGAVGFRPKQAKEFLSDLHTDGYKDQQRQFQEADGIGGKFKTAIENPSLIANTVVESLPAMGGGAVLARGMLGLGARGVAASAGGVGPVVPGALARVAGADAAPLVAGALGEGAVMAGAQAEAIRQETKDGLITPGQAGLSLATGALGTAFGYGGGKLAQKLGVGDIETMLAQGARGATREAADAADNPLSAVAAKSIPRQVIEGAITEGFLEELPQSMAEQILQNMALDKPWNEGLDDAIVLGTLSGMAMGAGAAGYRGATRPGQPAPTPDAGPTGAPNATGTPDNPASAPVLLLGNEPDNTLIGFPDGSVGRKSDVDAYLNSLPENERFAAQAKLLNLSPQPADPAAPAAQPAPANPGLERVRTAFNEQLAALQEQEAGAADVPQTTPPDGAAILQQQREAQEQARQAQIEASRAEAGPDDEIYQSTGADAAPVPVRRSEAMGLDPALGGLTAAAATAVDNGASDAMQAAAAQAQAMDAAGAKPATNPQESTNAQATPQEPAGAQVNAGARSGAAAPVPGLGAPAADDAGRGAADPGAYEAAAGGQPGATARSPGAGNAQAGDGGGVGRGANHALKNTPNQPQAQAQQAQEAIKTGVSNGTQADQTQQTSAQPAQAGQAPAAAGLNQGAAPAVPAAPPVVLQNRDRNTASSIAQMNAIAAKPDYLRTGQSRTMDQGAPVVFGETPASAVVGRTEPVVDGRGDRINTRYAVMEAADLLTSNSADGTANDQYSAGAPGKLRAVAGNGRGAGLIEGYSRGTMGAYRAELEQDAQAVGVAPALVRAMQQPVLVRVMDEADVTPDIGDRSNTVATARLSPVEEAANDGRRIDLAGIAFGDNGEPTAQSIAGFVQSMPESERGNMLNADGTHTRQAADRLMAAVFKQAYGSDALVQLYAQATDPEARAVMSALAQAAGPMAQLANAGAFDMRGAVAEAAGMAVNAVRKGLKLSDLVKNIDLDTSTDTYVVAEFMAQNMRSARAMGEGLRNLAQKALEQVGIALDNALQQGMFGAQPTLTRANLLDLLKDDDGKTQAPSAQQNRPEPDAQLAQPEGGQRAGESAGPGGGKPSGQGTGRESAQDAGLKQGAPAQGEEGRPKSLQEGIAQARARKKAKAPADTAQAATDSGAKTGAQAQSSSALPPADIRTGDKVVVDGEAYTVTGPLKEGRKSVGVVASREDEANPYRAHQVFLRGDDAIRAKLAAQTAAPAPAAARAGKTAAEPSIGAQSPASAAPAATAPRGVVAKAAAAKKAREDYFTPGHIVAGYGGHDRVVSYHPGADAVHPRWSVTVRAVKKQGGQWVDVPGEQERAHSTQPSERELKAGPLDKAEAAAPAALELTSLAPAEAAARQEAQEKSEKAEAAAKRAADAEAAKGDERKRIAQASVRAADGFELGQDPMDSLTGQSGMFEAPPEPPAARATATKPAAYGAKNMLVSQSRADELRAKLREKAKNHLFSGLDTEMMAWGTELAAFHMEAGVRKFADFVATMASDLSTTPSRLKPYLRSWYNGARDLMEDHGLSIEGMDSSEVVRAEVAKIAAETQDKPQPKGNQDAPDPDARVERDSHVPAPEPAVGDAVQDDAGAAAAGPEKAGGRAGRSDGRGQQDGAGIPFGSAPVAGERGDQPVSAGNPAPELESILAGVDFSERGGDSGIDGVPPDSIPAAQVAAAADKSSTGLKAGIERARADKAAAVLKDIESIRATLPQLLPGQQEDVLKAETRFDDPKGYGMLFTNGTGTGKTFSGLGVIKRFALQGKSNTLVVVPDDKITNDWIDSAKLLGLNVSALKNTQDAGSGIVITSYANLGENDALASRQWDLVVADEAHSLMQSADGAVTGYLRNLRAITNHPDGAGTRHEMLNRDKLDEQRAINEKIKNNNTDMGAADAMPDAVAAMRAENARLEPLAKSIEKELRESMEAVAAAVDAGQGAGRTRMVALSATPFAYEKTVDWASGYLFEYADGYPYGQDGTAYNQPDPREYFFQTRFGYRMRYNKLTAPDAKVDSGLMQRQFNASLKKSGSLSGRMLDVAPDYDRRFVLVKSAIGNRIDEALEWLTEQSRNAPKEDRGMRALAEAINDQFKYLQKRYLLEAIKATEVVPIVKQHMAMGRKVVVFHDYKKGGGFNPFKVSRPAGLKAGESSGAAQMAQFNAALQAFNTKFGDLVNSNLGDMDSPIEVFKRELAGVLLVNGDEKKADLLKRYKLFQDDASGPQVMLVQSAKNKGWSGHDTTGKHQRVLINLGQPTAPTLAIQQEGRIYRTGQASDAIMRYLNTGTNWERWTFASTIAGRASTAENLGMGEMARALKDSFIQSFEESDAYAPGHEGEGKGGKARDAAANNALTEYDRAKSLYFSNAKKTSRTKAQEGVDYFATPEPVGLKMVEWLNARGGEAVLEPSGGHGAIARWFPEQTSKTVIEPSLALRSRLALAMNAQEDRIIAGTFEDHSVMNKYDGIAMNPPFGVGGKTAIEHLSKAATHLREGGRIVALIPVGPMADKRFDKWLYEPAERPLRPLYTDPQHGPVFKGDTLTLSGFGSESDIVVAHADNYGATHYVRPEGVGKSQAVNITAIQKVKPTGPRTEQYSPTADLRLVASILLPQSTFERAGTAVMTRIVVIEKQSDGSSAPASTTKNTDLSDIESAEKLFDALEGLALPVRQKAEAAEQESPVSKGAPAKGRAAPVPRKAAESAPAAEVGGTVLLGGKPYKIDLYTTNAGKELLGAWLPTRAEALNFGASTFQKRPLGWFVRERDFPNVSIQAGDGSAPAFSRVPANAPTADSNERLVATQMLVDGLTQRWTRMPEVIVARNMQDPLVPQRVRDYDAKLQSQGADGQARGFIYAGKVYLLSDKLKGPEQIAQVLFHEVLGHYGLRGAFGEGLAPILQQIGTMRRKDVLTKARAYGMVDKGLSDAGAWAAMSAKDRQSAAEEVLAEMAETQPSHGFVKRAIAAIRNWLRANVPGFKSLALTDADIIQAYILPARGYVTRQSETVEQAVDRSMAAAFGQSAYSRTAGDQTQTQAFKRWYGDWQNAGNDRSHERAPAGVRPDARGIDALPDVRRAPGMDRGAGVRAAREFDVGPGATFSGASGPTGADGTPLRLYHGTKDDITAFDLNHPNRKDHGWLGQGVYLTSSIDAAEIYAQNKRGNGGKVLMPLYAAVRNPYVATPADKTRIKNGGPAASLAFTERLKAMGHDGVVLDLGDGVIELVAFEPTQVKSVTGNNGDFDATNPDIRFSRSNLADLKDRAIDQLHQTLSHPGKVSLWDKTVGTMRHLAERNPAFKPVFESAQRHIDDVSMMANDAADHAPRILPRVDSWRDLGKKPVAAADNKAIGKALFEGTLSWGRDASDKPVLVSDLQNQYASLDAEAKAKLMMDAGQIDAGVLRMWRGLPLAQFEGLINSRFESKMLKAGVVWSDKELKTLMGMNDQQVGLYREARAAVDRSIDMTSRASMLRLVGEKYAPLREVLLEQPTLQDAMELLTSTLVQDANADPDASDLLMQQHNQVVDLATKARELMDAGYMPLSRFGQYTLDVVDAAGERQYFSMFESKREANLMALQMRSAFPGASVVQGTMSAQAFKLFQGVTPESLEMFGNMLGLDSDGNEAKDKAFQAYVQLAKNNHSAMKRLIHRKGIAGYSEDVGRTLSSFVYSNARQAAGAMNAGTMEKAVQAIPKEQGELVDMAMGLRSYISDPQEEGQAVRGMLFAQYLGGSVASAFVNMTQPFAVTLPWLSQFGGMAKAGKFMSGALKDMGTRGFQYEPRLAQALKLAEEDGTVSPQEIHQLMAQSRGAGGLRSGDGTRTGDARAATANAWARTKVAWGQPFALAEQFNRRSTFIAAYRMAQASGNADPAEFARKAVLETQFLYSKANKMRWGRGAVGGTLMTFKTYSISYLELMQRTWNAGAPGSPERAAGRRAVAWGMAMLMLMGGAGGLPFMEDAEDLIDALAQMMGYNVSSKQWRKQALEDVMGRELADFMERGLSGLPGAPVDVSGRLGMGNLLPGTGLFQTKQSHTRDMLELVGPAGDLVGRAFSGAGRALKGDVTGAALEVSPSAVRNATKGADMAASGIYKDTKGYKVLDTTITEALAKGLGFQPKSVAEVQEASSFVARSASFYTQTSSEIRAQWAKALFEKDATQVQAVRERLARWNENNPDQRITIRMPDVLKRVREMGKDRTERLAASTPKAMRQQMREELQRATP